MSFSLRNKSAILFDMDGVLYDSMPNHSQAWSQAMAKFGMHMTPHDVYLNEGATGHDTVSCQAHRRFSARLPLPV